MKWKLLFGIQFKVQSNSIQSTSFSSSHSLVSHYFLFSSLFLPPLPFLIKILSLLFLFILFQFFLYLFLHSFILSFFLSSSHSILLSISFLSSPLASLLTYRHEHCLHSHGLRIVHAVNLIPQLYNRGWTTSRYVWTCQLENIL